MIKSITIENFKGIREPVTFELKPVTLLFGGNSSGKSTLLQSLHYLSEILLRHNLDVDQTLHGGPFVELGGFRNFVHLRDTNREIRFTIDFETPENTRFPFRSTQAEIWDEDEMETCWHLSGSWQMTLTVAWSNLLSRPMVTRYKVQAGMMTCEILSSLDERQIRVENFNIAEAFLKIEEGVHLERYNNVVGLWTEVIADVMMLDGWTDALPDLEQTIEVSSEYWDGSYPQSTIQELEWLLTRVLVWPARTLRDDLRQFRYIGPIREIPPRNHVPVRSPDPWRWANGLAAWDLLASDEHGLIETVNDWLTGEQRLNCGFSVHKREVLEVDKTSPFLRALLESKSDLDASTELHVNSLKSELSALLMRPSITLFDERKRLEVSPQDIGVGISQMLPVVTGCLDRAMRILAVEQPELHIHPALQARLADLFIRESSWFASPIPPKRAWRKTIILETHSEHIILRLLRRIRETAENRLDAGLLAFKPEDLKVYYVEPGNSDRGMKLTTLRVDTNGDFVDRWPEGFFEERIQEFL